MLSGPLYGIGVILSTQGANTAKMVDQLLATRFLVSMSYIVPMCTEGTQLTHACWTILHDILPSYGIYRTRLLQMRNHVAECGPRLGTGFDKNYKHGILAFEASLFRSMAKFKQYKRGSVYVFNCGNPEVSLEFGFALSPL